MNPRSSRARLSTFTAAASVFSPEYLSIDTFPCGGKTNICKMIIIESWINKNFIASMTIDISGAEGMKKHIQYREREQIWEFSFHFTFFFNFKITPEGITKITTRISECSMSHSNIWRGDVCSELIFDSIKVFFNILVFFASLHISSWMCSLEYLVRALNE